MTSFLWNIVDGYNDLMINKRGKNYNIVLRILVHDGRELAKLSRTRIEKKRYMHALRAERGLDVVIDIVH